MKTCGYCGSDNPDSARTCSGCRVSVTEYFGSEVDPVLTDPAYSLVILATFQSVVAASLLQTRLEAAGIEACIPEELNPQIFWNAVPSPLERVTVRVAVKDYEAAKRLLDEPGPTA